MLSVFTSLSLLATEGQRHDRCMLVIPHMKGRCYADSLDRFLHNFGLLERDETPPQASLISETKQLRKYCVRHRGTVTHTLCFRLVNTVTAGNYTWSVCTMRKYSWHASYRVERVKLPREGINIDDMVHLVHTLCNSLADIHQCAKEMIDLRSVLNIRTSQNVPPHIIAEKLRRCVTVMDSWVKTDDDLALDVILLHVGAVGAASEHVMELHYTNADGRVVVNRSGCSWEGSPSGCRRIEDILDFQCRSLALAMALHKRLGNASIVKRIPSEILRKIAIS